MMRKTTVIATLICCLFGFLLTGVLMPLIETASISKRYSSVELDAQNLYKAILSLSRTMSSQDVFPSDDGFNSRSSYEYFATLDSLLRNQTDVTRSFVEMATVDRDITGKARGTGWSIIKNLPSNPPINLPILVSRNIDVSTLSGRVDVNTNEVVLFNDDYQELLDQRVAVVVYSDGLVMRFRRCDGISYYNFYRRRSMILDQERPLKYLTPLHEISVW